MRRQKLQEVNTITINTKNDLEKVKDPVLYTLLRGEFTGLFDTYSEDLNIETFSLEKVGSVILVETDAEVPKGKFFEYVVLHHRYGIDIYEAGLLLNNETVVSYYIPDSILSEENREWLWDEAE